MRYARRTTIFRELVPQLQEWNYQQYVNKDKENHPKSTIKENNGFNFDIDTVVPVRTPSTTVYRVLEYIEFRVTDEILVLTDFLRICDFQHSVYNIPKTEDDIKSSDEDVSTIQCVSKWRFFPNFR